MFGKNEPRQENGADTNGAARDDRPATAMPTASGRVQHSILSADVRLTGDLASDGDITVEGTIDGSIKCRSLTLVGQPSINGTVEAETVHVCGSFAGEIRANKVILNKTAKMRGDIYHETLEVQTGADFEGKVTRLPASRSKATTASKTQASNGRDRSHEAETGVRSPA